MRPAGREGYSFVEMLTAIAVLGLMLAMTILSMAPSVQRGKVRSAMNVVSMDFQQAQTLAIRYRRPMLFLVQPSTRQYLIRDRDSAAAVHVKRDFGVDGEFPLDTLTASPTSVEIFPSGQARETITVRLGIEGYVREVKLTRAGQISKVPF